MVAGGAAPSHALAFLRSCPPENDPLEFIFGDLAKEFTADEEKVLCALTYFSLPVKVEHIAEIAGLEEALAETALRARQPLPRRFPARPLVPEFPLWERAEVVARVVAESGGLEMALNDLVTLRATQSALGYKLSELAGNAAGATEPPPKFEQFRIPVDPAAVPDEQAPILLERAADARTAAGLLSDSFRTDRRRGACEPETLLIIKCLGGNDWAPMKRTLILTVVFCFLASESFAQKDHCITERGN